VRALREALAGGALPFTCQGDLNGLGVVGGQTLAWELVESGVALDRLVVQVGGGALASACAEGLADAHALGATRARPRIDTVQTEGAWPLRRAHELVMAHGGTSALTYASHHRSEFMWPWEQEPHSIAHGILDDETYDWLAVVEAMCRTGGVPVVVAERSLEQAHELARASTGIPVDPTGSAGLAGLLTLREREVVHDGDRVAVLFTGIEREARSDEKLSRTRHPVAEGLRAR
jgi:threonine synthase